MRLHWLVRSTLSAGLLTAQIPFAISQQPGPGCGPNEIIKCNPGKEAAILSAFVGAGVLALYLGYRMDHPKQQMLVAGCVTDVGGELALTDDSSQTVYLVNLGRKKIKAGQRVVLRGRTNRDASGRDLFRVSKVAQDQGTCEASSSSP
jgi:hypothetical protein